MRWPLVGRADDLARIERLLTGTSRAVAVYGPTGVGRSRVAQELVDVWGRDGGETLWAAGTSAAAAVPFSGVAALLPALNAGDVDPIRVIQATRRALGRRAAETPLLAVVDDAHLMDDASLTLLRAIVGVPRLFLLLTVDSDAPIPAAATALWRDAGGERVDLAPLDRPETHEVVVAALGGAVDAAALVRLWDLSRGCPLILVELVRAAQDQQALVLRAGRWQLDGHPPLSARLLEITAPRLSGVTGAPRRALEAVALSEPIGLDVLLDLVGVDAVEALEASRHVEVTVERRRRVARLTRPLDGEVVRATGSQARLVRRANELLDLLEKRHGRRRGDAAQLAELWQVAGRPGRAELFVEAAREALADADHARAADLAERAVDRDGGFPALIAWGEAVSYQGRGDDAERILSDAATVAADDEQVATAALARFSNHLLTRGVLPDAEACVRTARPRVTEPAWQDELDAALAMAAVFRTDLPAALEAGRGVLERPDPHPRTLLSVLVVTSLAHAMLGDVEEALTEVERARPFLEPLREARPLAADQIGITEVLALTHDARIDAALELAAAGDRRTLEDDTPGRGGSWATTHGLVLADGGRFALAAERLDAAVAQLQDADPLGLRGAAIAIRARSLAALGRLEPATSLLSALDRQEPADLRTQLLQGRARAWLAAAQGDSARACEIALEVGQRGLAGTYLVWGAAVLHDAVRFGRPEEALDLLAPVAEAREAGVLRLYVDHARALAQEDPGALLEVAASFSAAGLHLVAAEATAQAAEAARQVGDHRCARYAAARAAELARRVYPATTPAVAAVRSPLTAREREVALLAMSGASSREIADQLVLSVRTVDNYLASVYRKTGVEGRRGLSEILIVDPRATT